MSHNEVRKRFLEFFKNRGHKIVPSSPLLDKSDPSVLLTSAGMQQFKPYYSGQKDAYSELGTRRVATVQKCFRTSDIDQVGDKDHLTFLEMLGNFSFGDYYKQRAIRWAYELLSSKFEIRSSKLWVTVFKGDEEIPADKNSRQVWLELGIPEERISGFGREDNFWGPTGEQGPCGPTTEIHYDLTAKPCGDECGPNCHCGRFIEVWNIVFNQYYQDKAGNLRPLKQKGIDTGMGLERLLMVLQNKKSVFETDVFKPALKKLRSYTYKSDQNIKKQERIILDHIRGACFLIAEGLQPSNLKEGYILRRVIRRAVRYAQLLGIGGNWAEDLIAAYVQIYKESYPELLSEKHRIIEVFNKEAETFRQALRRGLKRLAAEIKALPEGVKVFPGDVAFDLYQSYGLPPSTTKSVLTKKGMTLDAKGFNRAQERHKQASKSEGPKKKGGLKEDASEKEVALHTATHLLQAALRKVLGEEVIQKGSDINKERLRFDFSWPKPMTKKEINQVEDLVNKKIQADLEVEKQQLPLAEAIKSGALAPFKDRYPEQVSVYTIKDPSEDKGWFSKEICLGPHVESTGKLGKFKIIKETSSAAGIRRIKATLTDDNNNNHNHNHNHNHDHDHDNKNPV